MPISAALLYVKLGGYDQVVKTADDELKLDSLSKLAHLARARALLRLGKYQPALADYRALLLLTKDAPTIKEEMAIAESLAKQAPAPYGDLSLLPATDEKRQRKFPALRNGKKVVVSVAQLASDHKGDYRVYSAICGALKQKSMLKPLSSELDKMLAIDPADSSAVGSKIEATEALRNWPEAEKLRRRY